MDESQSPPAGALPEGSSSEEETDEISDEINDEIIVALSDYHDGLLPPARRTEIEGKLSSDPAWRAVDEELRAARPVLTGLGKVSAPEQFATHVTETIHRRSAGRFFARRTLGDRLPVGWLVVIAFVLLGGLTTIWCRSTTGSLRAPMGDGPPRPTTGESLAPKP
ncbi:MAG: hypothetical protein IPI49_30330 [Myxococcales bacterium]|jgi:anti-sigma factor RsiW|nr:hypothetical protein [Myxococcales bacterium]